GCPNPLGKRAQGNQLQIDFPGQHHLFQQLVLADVTALVGADLSGVEHEAESKLVNANVVADGVEVLDAFLHQRPDEVLRNPAQPESADHDARAIVDISDRL